MPFASGHFLTLYKAVHTQNLGILRAATGTANIEPMTSIATTFGFLTSKLYQTWEMYLVVEV